MKTKNAEVIILPNNLIADNCKVPESLLYCFYLYFIKGIKLSDKDAVTTKFHLLRKIALVKMSISSSL